MRKVVMWNMVTLDGFFEGPKRWEIGALLFGRIAHEGMAAYWTSAAGEIAEFMHSVPKVVFSRTLERAQWSNTRLVRGSAEEMRLLEARPLTAGVVLLRYEPA